MKFLLDENLSKKLAIYFSQLGHSVLRIKKINPGINDYLVLELALSKDSILITADKDFGELVFKEKLAHCGIILLRLQDETPDNTIKAIQKLIPQFDEIKNHFVVISEKDGMFQIRINPRIF